MNLRASVFVISRDGVGSIDFAMSIPMYMIGFRCFEEMIIACNLFIGTFVHILPQYGDVS